MIAQPDHVINRHASQQELVAAQELLWYAATPFKSALHGKEPLKWLAARVDMSQDHLMQEIKEELLEVWGSHGQEGKQVKVFETLLSVVNRIAWQLVAGKALCKSRVPDPSSNTLTGKIHHLQASAKTYGALASTPSWPVSS